MTLQEEITKAVNEAGITAPITNGAEVAANIKQHGQGVARTATGKEVLIRRQVVAQPVN